MTRISGRIGHLIAAPRQFPGRGVEFVLTVELIILRAWLTSHTQPSSEQRSDDDRQQTCPTFRHDALAVSAIVSLDPIFSRAYVSQVSTQTRR